MTLTDAEVSLVTIDPLLGELISRHGSIAPRTERGYFEALSNAIIGQQISVKAAAKIFERFQEVTKLQPQKAAHLSDVRSKLSVFPDKNHGTCET